MAGEPTALARSIARGFWQPRHSRGAYPGAAARARHPMDCAVQDERDEQSRAIPVAADRARRYAHTGAARAHAARADDPGRTIRSIDGGVTMRRLLLLATALAVAACGSKSHEEAKVPEAAPPEPAAAATPAPAPTADAAAIDAAVANADRPKADKDQDV